MHTLTRFLPLLAFSLLWLGTSCHRESSLLTTTPKHVILISIDTCRADYVEPYGTVIKTPTLAALAKEGILFENAVTPVPLTIPAHSTLFTGLHPIQHGVRDNFNHALSDLALTLPELFRESGFTTAGVVGAQLLGRDKGFMQGFDFYDDQFNPRQYAMRRVTVERKAKEVVDRSQAWISRYLQEQNEKPFFLFMHFYDPHMQYAPPPPFNKIYADDLYGGEVAYVDSEIGRFIQSLQEQGLFDDAWIIVLGDHGEGLMDHGEHTHGLFLYEEAVRVPLIIKPPVGTHLKTNTTVTPSVSIADIMPTLIELCQLGAVDTSGKSLVPWLEGKKTDEDRAMVTETLYPLTYNWSPLYSLRTNTWKYIHAPKPELYDLRNDPKEKKNVIAEHPSRTQSMKTELEQALVEYGRNKPFTPDINVSAGNAEILASLGYVGGGSTETDDAALFGDTVKRADPKDRLKEYIDIDIALQMVMENDYYNALKIFNSVLKTDPGNPSAITNIGMVYSRMGNYNTAIKYAQNAVTQAPDNIMIQLQLSQLYIYTNQAALAREILLPLAQAHPKLTDVHFQLGDLALREKKPEEALTYFEKIKTWRPDLPGLDEKIQSIKDSL